MTHAGAPLYPCAQEQAPQARLPGQRRVRRATARECLPLLPPAALCGLCATRLCPGIAQTSAAASAAPHALPAYATPTSTKRPNRGFRFCISTQLVLLRRAVRAAREFLACRARLRSGPSTMADASAPSSSAASPRSSICAALLSSILDSIPAATKADALQSPQCRSSLGGGRLCLHTQMDCPQSAFCQAILSRRRPRHLNTSDHGYPLGEPVSTTVLAEPIL
jgi:hypothetical protein